jgi:hypothetical protein
MSPSESYAVSAALFFVSVSWSLWTARKLNSWHRTVGRVVEVKKEWQSDSDGSSLMHAPVVEFTTIEDNRTVSFQDSVWTSPGWHTPGDSVEVCYNPSNPTQATLAGWRPYAVPIFIVLASVFFLLFALIGNQR